MSADADPNHLVTRKPTNDNEVLDYTLDVRMSLVNRMLSGEEEIKLDNDKGVRLLAALLKDADSQVLTKQRIAAADKAANNIGDMAAVLDGYLQRKLKEGGQGFQRHDGDEDVIEGEVAGPANLKSLKIPKLDFIEGQLDPSGAEVDIEDIMARGREAQRSGD